jgi:hypothetical protein
MDLQERINDLPIAKPERKRFALVLKRRELAHMGSNGTAHLWQSSAAHGFQPFD